MNDTQAVNCIVNNENSIQHRFRGFFPVAIDVETAGFNPFSDALLEIAATTFSMDEQGWLQPASTLNFNVVPFANSTLNPEALKFLGIKDPFCNERNALSEDYVLKEVFKFINKEMKNSHCKRAVMVAHNAKFDHDFIQQACLRQHMKRNPFHPFTTFDTASLSALTLGETVFAQACQAAGIIFDHNAAHSASYDCKKTAELFSYICNHWKQLGGWPRK